MRKNTWRNNYKEYRKMFGKFPIIPIILSQLAWIFVNDPGTDISMTYFPYLDMQIFQRKRQNREKDVRCVTIRPSKSTIDD